MALHSAQRYIRSRRGRWFSTVVLTAAAALTAAGCAGSGSSSSAPKTGTVKSGGQLTFALDEDVAGFNPLLTGDTEFVLQEILNQTLPQVFTINNQLKPQLNTELVSSATVTNNNPQTIVYKINPKAVWSDGTPINADDFIYNWQSQSGSTKFKDVGGKTYLPASTSGYSSIASVTGSDNGKTVTVVMAQPYGDWQSLFSVTNPLIPAHIAKTVGFNAGFQNFGPAVQVSGGPYMIQSYTKGESLVEVRNPHYWGPPGKLSKILYRFILSDAQQPAAIQNNEANMVNPVSASIPYLDSIKNIPGFTTDVIPGLEFQHIDFNEANPYLKLASVRHAIAFGTNRQQLISKLVSPLDVKPAVGLLNSHFFMPVQPQYSDNSAGAGAYDPAQAKTLLQQAGMTMGSDGYFHPNFGPEKGQDFSLTISTTSGVEVRSEIEQLLQADYKQIGVKLNIHNYTADALFGTVGPKSEYDIIEFAWVLSPFASANQSIYCDFKDAADCGDNWNNYSNPQVTSLMKQAVGTVDPTQSAALWNQADKLMWKDMVTLPLYEQPQLWGWTSSYLNIVPNASNVGITWNAQAWGAK
ncbi:MAG TPA: ABC transporter family substrate-binding protein [Streptosporangiaceae bacterium]|nr:ABC transporter family substrate-binding protein [Streptosporangiaceae bacterium]